MGEGKVRNIFESHLISRAAFDILLRDPFGPEDFEAFISERQRTIQEAIENLLIKERLDLSPQLREIGEHVERVELGIRKRILETLTEQNESPPPHVMQKVNERIARNAKKDASFNAEDYQVLEKQLEYFDLRELQDTIVTKSLWPHFESAFKSKESLATKFGQLADVRNGIRHSRALSQITQKEGEAALLWFDQVFSTY